MPKTTAPMSLRAFAKRLGVSHTAVGKGIRNGRIERALGFDLNGRPMIADPDLAEREWRDNYDPSRERRF
jgi:hypothetical protein